MEACTVWRWCICHVTLYWCVDCWLLKPTYSTEVASLCHRCETTVSNRSTFWGDLVHAQTMCTSLRDPQNVMEVSLGARLTYCKWGHQWDSWSFTIYYTSSQNMHLYILIWAHICTSLFKNKFPRSWRSHFWIQVKRCDFIQAQTWPSVKTLQWICF